MLLCLSALALAGEEEPSTEGGQQDSIEGWEAAMPPKSLGEIEEDVEDPGELEYNWMDSSHAYATDRAQALTEWMDGYFGDPNYDIERAESLLRIEWTNEWDEEDRYNTNLRLRGKLQLPRLSRRLNLVFSGEDGDQLTDDERSLEDRVGFQYKVGEKNRSRVDLTLGINWDGLRPGIRYRNQGPIGERYRYRYTQRLQWEDDEGFFTTGQINLDRALTDDKLLRWSNRAVYGEETQDVEWRSRISLAERHKRLGKRHQLVVAYFASVNGVTDPSFVKNYNVGMLFRRQFYRQYLFVELEPTYNLRKRREEDQRKSMWALMLRFEVALERDLLRRKGAAGD